MNVRNCTAKDKAKALAGVFLVALAGRWTRHSACA